MTDQELIELYKSQRDAAEALCQHAKADARQANIRADYAEHRINELEAAIASEYRRGVVDGIERVRKEAGTSSKPSGGINYFALSTRGDCDQALAAFEAENVRLAAIVDRLPKTADGVLVSECEVLFLVHVDVDQPMAVRECVFDLVNKEAFVTFHKAQYMVSAHCYSTREAAEAAAKEEK